ncbi:NlpC/P60 family protein [Actinomadura sp. B10D3]|uniref:C40 family peptidase n=1 Tax=Actinomadura sp. B10D3 TaxID=3153557 RepID=UPI00325D124A
MPALAAGAALVVILLVVIIGAVSGATSSSRSSTTTCAPEKASPATAKAADIPATYLDLYMKAGKKYGIPWPVLAAVGAAESDHGRSRYKGVRSGENHAGAAGPMQFQAATWEAFGVDGDRDGETDRYDPADAIPSAARYLKHNGAPARLRAALYRYNQSWTYVNDVLARARTYAQHAKPTDGNACAAPAGVRVPSGTIEKIITFAMAQRGKRYVFGATGPDAWDCSSLVQAAYRAAGFTIPRTTFAQWPFGARIPKGSEQPGDLVFFNSGPGTSSSSPGHVGLVIAPGKMVAARCSTCIPNIGVQSYKRSDWMGVTRPLLRLGKSR